MRTSEKYRKIYEDHWGVNISDGFQVHHIDGDSHNNNPINLVALSLKDHDEAHKSMGDIRLGNWVGYSERGWKASIIRRAKGDCKNSLKGSDRTDAQKLADLVTQRGNEHYEFDHRIHIFNHEEHGKFVGHQFDFYKKYNLFQANVSCLVVGVKTQMYKGKVKTYKVKSVKGWTYHGIHGE